MVKSLLSMMLLTAPAFAQPPLGDASAARNLVEVKGLDPSFKLDVRYATRHNFMGRVLYSEGGRVFLAKPAAEALVRVQARLRRRKLGLVLFDGYRPWSVTKMMWDETAPEKRRYVADPAKGSRHNRGCAIDLTLQDLVTGKYLEMPTGYDDFTVKAHADAPCTALAAEHRKILREVMAAEGFQIFPYEWWHYDYHGWEAFPLLNFSFAELSRLH